MKLVIRGIGRPCMYPHVDFPTVFIGKLMGTYVGTVGGLSDVILDGNIV